MVVVLVFIEVVQKLTSDYMESWIYSFDLLKHISVKLS